MIIRELENRILGAGHALVDRFSSRRRETSALRQAQLAHFRQLLADLQKFDPAKLPDSYRQASVGLFSAVAETRQSLVDGFNQGLWHDLVSPDGSSYDASTHRVAPGEDDTEELHLTKLNPAGEVVAWASLQTVWKDQRVQELVIAGGNIWKTKTLRVPAPLADEQPAEAEGQKKPAKPVRGDPEAILLAQELFAEFRDESSRCLS